MTPDQLRYEETRAWLDRARRDLRAAKLLIAGDANGEALFHFQQAVEEGAQSAPDVSRPPVSKNTRSR